MDDEVYLTRSRSVNSHGLFGVLAVVAVGAVALSSDTTWGAAVAGATATVSVVLGAIAWRNELHGDYAIADNLIQALTNDVLLFLVGAPAGIAALVVADYNFDWTWWGASAFGLGVYLAAFMLAMLLRAIHPDNPDGFLLPTFVLSWGRASPAYAWRRRWILEAVVECWIAWDAPPESRVSGRVALLWRQDARRLPWRLRRFSKRFGGIPPYGIEFLTFDSGGYVYPVANAGVGTIKQAEAEVAEVLGEHARRASIDVLPAKVIEAYVQAVRRGGF